MPDVYPQLHCQSPFRSQAAVLEGLILSSAEHPTSSKASEVSSTCRRLIPGIKWLCSPPDPELTRQDTSSGKTGSEISRFEMALWFPSRKRSHQQDIPSQPQRQKRSYYYPPVKAKILTWSQGSETHKPLYKTERPTCTSVCTPK